MIQVVQKRCPDGSGEWADCGATVHIVHTWMMGALRDARAIYARDLEGNRRAIARIGWKRHCDTIMAERTHGQQGLLINLRFQGRELGRRESRHRQRLCVGDRAAYGYRTALRRSWKPFVLLGPRASEIETRFLSRLGSALQSILDVEPLRVWPNGAI